LTKEYWKDIEWFLIFFIYKIIYNVILFLLYYNLFILNWIWLLFAINLNYILLFFLYFGVECFIVGGNLWYFLFWLLASFCWYCFFFLRGTIPKFGWGICILFFYYWVFVFCWRYDVVTLSICYIIVIWVIWSDVLLLLFILPALRIEPLSFIDRTPRFLATYLASRLSLTRRRCKFFIFLWSNTWGQSRSKINMKIDSIK
jgi:hypothetical protein